MSHSAGHLRAFLVSAGLLLVAAAARADAPARPWPVKEVHNVAYYDGAGADPVRHRLDLYLPEGKKNFPVLVLVHGGAWVLGDRTFFGWGEDLGRYFASRGLGVVMPSYRLSPAVRHPEHVKDVARAFAWTYRTIARYGGSPRRLFLCGHSAGGHLVSLLATDPTYLRAEGLSGHLIRGVISVSGVYRIPAIDLSLGLSDVWAGARSSVAGLFTDGPSRPAPTPKAKPAPPQMPVGRQTGLAIPLNLFATVFGTDPRACAAASPLCHVRPGLPPFLLVSAEHDLPFLPAMARDFAQALRAAHDEVQVLQVKGRGHEDVMFLASNDADPVARAIEAFVRDHRGRGRPAARSR